MSRKYITEQIVENFIFPNRDQPEYGMEIVHDINNNSVSGEVVSFTATTVSSTGMTFNMDYTWLLNNAEPFIRNSNELSLCSVHMSVPLSLDYKPWIVVQTQSTSLTGSAFFNGSTSFSVVPSQFGIDTFENGLYYFEVRFIGHRAIYPICLSYQIGEDPTPTPTETPFAPTISPTPTPEVTATPTPTPTSEVELRIETNASLDISISTIQIDALNPSVIGGTLPNTSGNGTDLLYALPYGTYDLVVYYSAGVAGQRISVSSPLTGYACQNTSTGSGSLTFTGVGFGISGIPFVLAEDGTC